jgi:putative oxidoreductase
MTAIKKWNKWANDHSYWIIDVIRVLVGAFIVYKGFHFMNDPANYDLYNEPLKQLGTGMIVMHTVVAFNIIGGIMIIVGLLTRWAIFAQIPVLLGAILMNFIGKFELDNLLFSVLIFLICLFFLFFGSGRHSADYYFKMEA